MRPHALCSLLCLVALSACTRTADDSADTDLPVDTGAEDTDTDTDTDTEEDQPIASFSVGTSASVAGEEVALTVTLTYADGTTEAPAYTLASDLEAAITATNTTLTPTVAGVHTLTVTLTDSGTELTQTLDVSPAAATELVLTATPSEGIDPDGFTIFTVSQHDAYGNATTEVITLVSDPEGPVVASDSVTFPAEGSFLLTATSESGASAQVGPLVIDATGPELLLSAPARGAVLPEGSNTVQGTVLDDLSAVTEATLGGTTLTLDGSGAFTHTVDLPFGMTLLEGSSTDSDGNTSTSVTSLVAGSVEALGSEDSDGLVLRVYEGADGLDALAATATSAIDASAIYAGLPDPLYQESGTDCRILFGQNICSPYAIEVTATSLTLGSLTSTLDPTASETLVLTLTATNLELPWEAQGNYGPQSANDSGTATVDTLTVQTELTLELVNGALVASVVSTDTQIDGLDMGFTGQTAQVVAAVGANPEPEIEAAIEVAADQVMQARLGSAVTDALSGIGIAETVPLASTTATLAGEPSELSIDDHGITIALATTVQLDAAWPTALPNPGALRSPFTAPTYGASTGAAAALSGDVLNQLLYAGHGAGVLNTTATNEELGLDMTTVSLLLPALSDLTMVVTPTYAPLVRPNAADGLQLQLADLRVDLYNGDVDPSLLTYALYASLEADVELLVTDGALSLQTASPVFTADVVLAPTGTNTASLETALELLMVLMLDDLTGSIAAIPMPSLAGAAFVDGTAAVAGAEGGYIEVSGKLESP